MKSKKNLIISSAVGIFAFVMMAKAINYQMKGFSYLNFTLQAPENFAINFQNPEQTEVDKILDQKFSYLCHGGESIVFASNDQKWVLKLHKRNRLDPLFALQGLRVIPFLDSYLYERTRVYERFFHSLRVQAEKLGDVSGLFYIHLPSDNEAKRLVTLQDPIGSFHTYDLSKLVFHIQRKGDLFKNVYLNTPSLEDRKAILKTTVALYKKLEIRGFKIWDNAVSRNMGWADNGPFIIDAGCVCDKPRHETFEQNLKHLKTWVSKHEPMLLEYLSELIAAEQASDAL
jgi:hypothetical protein